MCLMYVPHTCTTVYDAGVRSAVVMSFTGQLESYNLGINTRSVRWRIGENVINPQLFGQGLVARTSALDFLRLHWIVWIWTRKDPSDKCLFPNFPDTSISVKTKFSKSAPPDSRQTTLGLGFRVTVVVETGPG